MRRIKQIPRRKKLDHWEIQHAFSDPINSIIHYRSRFLFQVGLMEARIAIEGGRERLVRRGRAPKGWGNYLKQKEKDKRKLKEKEDKRINL